MRFTKVKDVKTPQRGTTLSAGLDFFVPDDFEAKCLNPGESVVVPSGLKLILDPGTVGVFNNKSSIGKDGILVGSCVIDADYRGEVGLSVTNASNAGFRIVPGMKLVQLLIYNVDLTRPLEISNEDYETNTTERGAGGFGSTGRF